MKKIKKFSRKSASFKSFDNGKKERDERQSLYHTQKWRNFRFRFVKDNPRCFSCGESEKTIHVDHIEAHKGNEEKFFDPYNVIPLCYTCHNYITSKFDKFKIPKLKEKMEWIKSNREKLGLKFPIKFKDFKE